MLNPRTALPTLLLLLCAVGSSCKTPETPAPIPIRVKNVQLSDYGFEVYGGETMLTLYGEGFRAGDRLSISGSQGSHTFTLTGITASSADFTLPAGIKSGEYTFTLLRGSGQLELGTTRITVLTQFAEIPDAAGMNIKGYVRCGDTPLKGVVVTDGYSVTTTNAQGIYYIARHTDAQFVIMSVPGNYEANITNNIPGYFKRLKKGGSAVERHDFTLRKFDNERHVVITPTDLHLSNRFDKQDIVWFREEFVKDMDALVEEYKAKGIKTYMMPLGDLTSDAHWYLDGYDLTHYMKEIITLKAPVFNCMGNHDNDVHLEGDWAGEQTYKDIVGPTYYSFNLGSMHYIVLDNSIWINPPGSQSQIEPRVADNQIEWLKKDLQHVDKTKPLYIGMHCQMAALTISGMDLLPSPHLGEWKKLFDCFAGFSEVHFLTGHTHIQYNVDYSNQGYPNIHEHNAGAVSGVWYWPQYASGKGICNDGAPCGYNVLDVDGTDVWRYYKSHGYPASKQFRTYDRNQIHITADKYMPKDMASATKSVFEATVGDFYTASSSNEVLINVWNFGRGWSIEVKEYGQSLPVTRIQQRDPMKILLYNAGIVIKDGRIPNNSAANGSTHHMFRVNAASATSTLEITVKDDKGNSYFESMKRPKSFSKTAYD